MKKLFIVLAIAALGLTAFKFINDKAAATVDQKEGIYIFICSKPAAEYQFLGSVKKTGLVMSGSPAEMFNTLMKRCRKDYPQADGIIFSSVDMDHADCVKFK